MKIFHLITRSAIDFFRFLAVLLILAVLVFIVKWRTNHLFALISPDKAPGNTIVEEIADSKDQLKDLTTAAKSVGDKDRLIDLKSSNLEEVALQLKKEGLIADEYAFMDQVKQGGFAPYITSGTFQIPEGVTVAEMIQILTKDSMDKASRTVLIEVPEGVDANGLATLLQREGIIQDAASFAAILQEQNALSRIKPGGYNIHVPIKVQDLVDRLAPPAEAQAQPAPQALPQENPSPDQAGQ